MVRLHLIVVYFLYPIDLYVGNIFGYPFTNLHNVHTLISATMVGGGGGAKTFKSQYALRQIAVFVELQFITKPEMGMFLWEQRDGKPVVDFATGDLINEQLKKEVVAQVVALRDFTKKQKMGDAAFKLLSNK